MEKELDKILIEETERRGKNPFVIWVPEWVEPFERKKYFVLAAKEKAREISLKDGSFLSVSGRDVFGEYLELARDIPKVVAFAVKLVYNYYKSEMFSSKNLRVPGPFVSYINRMAREVM
ncbi:MAG: hypothetical protein ABH840_01680 [Nanoarchaeota archaeon]